MLNGTGEACIGLALNVSHCLTLFHGWTGCGAFHLNSPTGGAANGMPLKMFMSPFVIPETKPASVFTTGAVVCVNDATAVSNEIEKASICFKIIFVELMFMLSLSVL